MSMDVEVETKNRTIGFTLDLIHRDSPQSPFYDPTLSSSQRMEKLLQRSLDRIHRFEDPPQTEIFSYATGYYLMKFSIGTPPISVFAIADTGSEITWLQCQPCDKCFRQKFPIFNPKSSSTYSKIPYFSEECRLFQGSFGDIDEVYCLYEESYADKSYSKGEASRETITLPTSQGLNLSFPNIRFGCGHDNAGVFRYEETGIVGLNMGETSLISQLDHVIEGKFSYCLVSLYHEVHASSKMNFGANAIVSGPGTVSTPLDTNQGLTSQYYLTLEGVSIFGERFDFPDYSSKGNIIIDSGSLVTYLPADLYEPIKERLKRAIYFKQVNVTDFDLCYFLGRQVLIFPGMIFHFKGADVKLTFKNVFISVSEEIICLAILPEKVHGVVVLGNIAQRNFMVGFDIRQRTVSFKPMDCSSFS